MIIMISLFLIFNLQNGSLKSSLKMTIHLQIRCGLNLDTSELYSNTSLLHSVYFKLLKNIVEPIIFNIKSL